MIFLHQNDLCTPFYPAHVLPCRIGVYEVMPQFGSPIPWYAYWDGEKFCFRSRSAKEAKKNKDVPTYAGRYAIWRGLKK